MKINKRSKRLTLGKKHKIEKKIREHHRDIRKKNKDSIHRKAKIEVESVPNNIPFRDEILKEDEKKHELLKAIKKERLEMLAKHKKMEKKEEKVCKIKDVSMAFAGDINNLIQESDVIIEVLDARDPIGTRSVDIEKKISDQEKTLILLINKIDLITRQNLKEWLSYLSQEAIVIPFKSSIQKQANNLGSIKNHAHSIDHQSKNSSFNVDRVLNELRGISKKKGGVNNVKKRFSVGVVGMPNVGKSSVINSLRRKKICESGQLAGLTRCLQSVAIDQNIMLIDSPGLIMSKTENIAENALRNCTRLETLQDPEVVAFELWKRCSDTQLRSKYSLSNRSDEEHDEYEQFQRFILEFGHRFIARKKGGLVDSRKAALRLINDWNTGNIFYSNSPPSKVNPNAKEGFKYVEATDEELKSVEFSGDFEMQCDSNAMDI